MKLLLLRLLGTVAIADGPGWTRAGPAKRSCVLAALAMTPGAPVSLATLAERVWGAAPPSSAHSTLYGHIAHLRAALADCPGEVAIERAGFDGYALAIEPELVDVHRLRALAAAARRSVGAGAVEAAAADWRRADALVLGEPLAGIKGDWAAEIRSGLRREHAALLVERARVELDLGREAELVEELSAQVGRHPLSEGLVECLMLALYRTGRTAEALSCFAEARSRLAERLGADPGARLRELHVRVLNQDPALNRPGPTAVAAPPLAQLPAPPRRFIGRTAELAELDAALAAVGGDRLLTISGPGGIGKSWLARHWAHRHRADFPDGQLYLNLRGFDPRTEPAKPESLLRGLLETLGVPPGSIPSGLDAMANSYRSLVAGKRLLILIDDAREAHQVVPLLPGDERCLTLVTGRPDLTGLAVSHDARILRLDTLSPDESRDALAGRVGRGRLAAEPEATDTLLRACAGHPLALGILAARAAARPGLPLTRLAESVRDETARLDALDTGELSLGLRAVLTGSLAAVSGDAARLFTLLGLSPGTDADRYAIASLAAQPLGRTESLLYALENANLIEPAGPGRYRMHDLTRLYAAERARADLEPEQRTAALRRLLDHYVHTAATGRRLMQRGLIPRDLGEPAPGCLLTPLSGLDDAKRWFADEHANLLAAQRGAIRLGWDATVWRLAWGPATFHIQRRRCAEGALMWQRAATAAARSGDTAGESVAHHTISQLLSFLGEDEGSIAHARRALELAETCGDPLPLAGAHDALGKSYRRRGDYRRALHHSTQGLELARRTGNRVLVAQGLNSVGWHRAHLGEYAEARRSCEEALSTAREIPEEYLAALILDSLGYIAARDDRPADAIVHYQESLTILRRFGVHEQVPTVMAAIAAANEALGEAVEAARFRREAAELYEAQGYPAEAKRLRGLLPDH